MEPSQVVIEYDFSDKKELVEIIESLKTILSNSMSEEERRYKLKVSFTSRVSGMLTEEERNALLGGKKHDLF